ncbi:MAG: S-layer homology domain-containing protein [bacterium]|nr:S-layer homology domain-containing protein [bacterium]MDE0288004.1 S-layer homology domain-containing protein [bacterium]
MARTVTKLAAIPLILALSIPAVVVATPAGAQATGSELCDTAGAQPFSDVDAGDYAADYVACMRALGLSLGRGDGSYGADSPLTRGQMATFLVRLWTDVLNRACPTGVVSPFTDTAGTTHAGSIDCLYGLGITAGTTATTYSPQDSLKASQISRFLFRTYEKAGDTCPDAAGSSELDRAVSCLLGRRVVPSEAEAAAATAVTRSQMAVYVIGLWHNLSGRGLPPAPPRLNEPTPRRPAEDLPALRIAYTAGTSYRAGPWSPDSTKILYYAGDYAGWGRGFPSGELWVVDADGANRRQLSIGGRNPVWSPDSTRVLYEDESDESQLWIVNADGSGKRQLSASGFLEEWSPDGARILYHDRDGLWIVNADGSGKHQISTRGRDVGWSPDSTSVLYHDYDRGGLWVVNADGSGEQQLTTTRRFEPGHGPSSWSPDGSKILYSHIVRGQDFGVDEMWVVNADGTNPQQLIAPGDGVFNQYSVVWSPDSSRVLFVRNDGGIWAGTTDGTKQQLTTRGGRPQFSPDGARILYTDSAESWVLGALWVMDSDGTNQRRVASGAEEPMVWSPDSSKITYNDGNERVWVVNADGTDHLQLVYAKCEGWHWPADSTRILYFTGAGLDRFAGIPLQISVVDTDGTNRKQVVDFGGSPTFSPDSARIAYSGPQGAIWVVDADGTNRRRLTTTRSVWVVNSDGTDSQQITSNGWLPQWSPDGTRLAFADSDGYRVVDPAGTISPPLGSPGSAGLQWSPDSTKISYINSLNGDLVFANADGTRLQPSYSGRGTSVRWSPDSARVTFQQSGAYWVMNADGTNSRQLTTGFPHAPSWSPDGTRIAYTDATDAYDPERGVVLLDRHRVRVVNADGKELHSVNGYGVAWSPDGTRIGYTVWSACEYDTAYDCPSYWVMNADGTNRRQLTDQDSGFEGWSPDSTRIAYRADGWLWVMNADGTNQRRLTDQVYRRAEWSPDSTGLLYWISGTSGEAPSDELWVVSADGTTRRQLTNQLFVTTSFWYWSPDGTRIGYLADGLWVADADGTNRMQLSDQEVSRATWSPDGTRIAYQADGLWVVNADGTNRRKLAEEGGFPRWAPLVV